MQHFKLILPEHLNHHGKLFGGNMLKWIDEFAYITATQEFPYNTFLTKALDNVVFRKAVSSGEIIRFDITLAHLGRTSVVYNIKTFGTRVNEQISEVLFETRITFVAVDDNGNKAEIIRPSNPAGC
jgi:acyl-CoA hydrolase